MRLSVIIPALNESAAIATTLADLLPLREHGAELIVVDGGSGDDTVAVATAGADRVLRGERGRARQMNAGAGAACGEWLWFVHADSRVSAAVIAQLEALLANGAAAHWGRFDVRLSGAAGLLRLVERAMNLRSRLTAVATGDQGIFVRRADFDALGGYPDIPLMEDVALSKRLRRLAPPACLPGPLVTSSRRWEQGGVLRTVLLMWALRLAYFLGVDPVLLARRYRAGVR